MPVIVRNPLGAVLAAAMLGAFVLLAYLGIDGWRDGDGDGDRRVLEIRAESASLIAADVAQLEERRRRNGDAERHLRRRPRPGLPQWPLAHRKARTAAGVSARRLEPGLTPLLEPRLNHCRWV